MDPIKNFERGKSTRSNLNILKTRYILKNFSKKTQKSNILIRKKLESTVMLVVKEQELHYGRKEIEINGFPPHSTQDKYTLRRQTAFWH